MLHEITIYLCLLLPIVNFAFDLQISETCEAFDLDQAERYSCISKGFEWSVCLKCDSTTSEQCDLETSEVCSCQHIEINGEGGGNCTSQDDQGKWCYVSENSVCKDIVDATDRTPSNFYLEEDLYISHEACNNFNQDDYETSLTVLGNEHFLLNVELQTDSDEDLSKEFGGGGFKKETPEQCQAECLARAGYCFGWTFDDYDFGTGMGTCKLKGDQVCCNQAMKKICKEGAISGFNCNNRTDEISCWSTIGTCPCTRHPPSETAPTFCAGCGDSKYNSGTGGIGEILKPCEYKRVIFKYVNKKWIPVKNDKPETC